MHFKDNELLAANELIDCIYSRYQLGGVIGDVEEEYGLKRDHTYYISKLDSSCIQPLSALVNARSAIMIEINYKVLNNAIQRCIDSSSSDINKLMRGVNDNFNFSHTPECQLLHNLIHVLYSQLDSFYDSGKAFETSLNAETIFLLSKLTGYKKSVLPFFLINKDSFRFKINHSELTFAIRAFETKRKNVNAVHELIKMGADYLFVRNYNDCCDVSLVYFRFMRKVYNINVPQLRTVELYKLTDAYSVFNEAMKSMSYKDSVIKACNSTKLNIATVTEAIERFNQEQCDDEEDDFDSDLDELLDLTS